jgi:hypothetical protein
VCPEEIEPIVDSGLTRRALKGFVLSMGKMTRLGGSLLSEAESDASELICSAWAFKQIGLLTA